MALPLKKSHLIWLLAAVAAYFALWLIVPRMTFMLAAVNGIIGRIPHTHGAGRLGLRVLAAALLAMPTVGFMAVQVGIVYTFARLRLNARHYLLGIVLSLGGIFGLLAIVIRSLGLAARLGHYPNLPQHLFIMGMYHGPLKLPMSLLMMLAAACIGCMASLRIKDKNLLLPVVILGAGIDCWTDW